MTDEERGYPLWLITFPDFQSRQELRILRQRLRECWTLEELFETQETAQIWRDEWLRCISQPPAAYWDACSENQRAMKS